MNPLADKRSQKDLLQQDINKGALDFAIKLNKLFYRETAKSRGNLLFSPINIYSGLALVHLGAKGKSREELTELLGFPKESDKIQEAHEILSQVLDTIPKTEDGVIRIANGIFVQKDVNIIQSYVSQVQNYYKGEVSGVDFRNNPTAATDQINGFVSKSTYGKIPRILQNPLPCHTSVVLASCLYFKGPWYKQFGSAKQENFNTGTVNVLAKMMTSRRHVPHVNLADMKLKAIRLDYGPGTQRTHSSPDSSPRPEVSMFFILPYENHTLDDLVSSLDGATLKRIVAVSEWTHVEVKIPQFNYEWSSTIDKFLKELGINEIFDVNAKFGNMIEDANVKLSQVTHATQIEVNAEGTEASAVTVLPLMKMCYRPPPPEPIPFYVDRPFLNVIYHHQTETVLFMGAVHNPNSA